MQCKVATLDTWFSPITIVETEYGVRYVDLDDGARQFLREASGAMTRVNGRPRSTDEFLAYFAGELTFFQSPVDLVGTPFQISCWNAMRAIPYGKILTYADQARSIGTRGYQAVGQANRRNPVPILIPCHRVVASSGAGGYFGGRLDLKRALLEFEGYAWPAQWSHDASVFSENQGRDGID